MPTLTTTLAWSSFWKHTAPSSRTTGRLGRRHRGRARRRRSRGRRREGPAMPSPACSEGPVAMAGAGFRGGNDWGGSRSACLPVMRAPSGFMRLRMAQPAAVAATSAARALLDGFRAWRHVAHAGSVFVAATVDTGAGTGGRGAASGRGIGAGTTAALADPGGSEASGRAPRPTRRGQATPAEEPVTRRPGADTRRADPRSRRGTGETGAIVDGRA